MAFHEGGLNYGDKGRTLNKLIQKCVRAALCLYGYFGVDTGEVIFASPKINPAIEKELSPLFEELSELFQKVGLGGNFQHKDNSFRCWFFCIQLYAGAIILSI